MKKIIFFLSALLLPFFAFEMSADDKTAVIKIPLKIDVEQNLNRSLVQDPIESCYYGMNQSICFHYSLFRPWYCPSYYYQHLYW